MGTRDGGGDGTLHHGGSYINVLGREAEEGVDRIRAAFGENYERLVALKNKYDPTNLFRHNQNIRPTVYG